MCHQVTVPRKHEKTLLRHAARQNGNGRNAGAKVSKRDLPNLLLNLPDGLEIEIDGENCEVTGSTYKILQI